MAVRWDLVRVHALAGAKLEEVVLALEVPEAVLKDPGVLARLKREIAVVLRPVPADRH